MLNPGINRILERGRSRGIVANCGLADETGIRDRDSDVSDVDDGLFEGLSGRLKWQQGAETDRQPDRSPSPHVRSAAAMCFQDVRLGSRLEKGVIDAGTDNTEGGTEDKVQSRGIEGGRATAPAMDCLLLDSDCGKSSRTPACAAAGIVPGALEAKDCREKDGLPLAAAMTSGWEVGLPLAQQWHRRVRRRRI